MKRILIITILIGMISAACSDSGQFNGWQVEEFGATKISESSTRTFTFGNPSSDREQHIRAIAFDRGSNSAGHFRIDRIMVGDQDVAMTDIVIPPGSVLKVQVTYAPMNLDITRASYGGWKTGEPKRWIPKRPEEVGVEEIEPIYQRAIVEAVYDYPQEGVYFVQLVGEARPGPNGEREAGGAFAACSPGNGTACYTGGFSLDIPELAPGGPKPLDMTGPIKMSINGGQVDMRMDDFPFVLYVLRSEDIPQLPSGVTATLVLSGAQGAEAIGTFDGSRLEIQGVVFRIRVGLGEITVDQIRQGISALVDFEIPDLEITTVRPLDNGAITLRLETLIPQNPSGNELFDQFLSGAHVTAVLEGELAF